MELEGYRGQSQAKLGRGETFGGLPHLPWWGEDGCTQEGICKLLFWKKKLYWEAVEVRFLNPWIYPRKFFPDRH